MRLLVIEKHEAVQWREQEAAELAAVPDFTKVTETTEDVEANVNIGKSAEAEPQEVLPTPASPARLSYRTTAVVAYLLFTMTALTPVLISFLNGFIFGGRPSSPRKCHSLKAERFFNEGIYNTALVLRLNQRYGLDSEKYGLAFLAIAIPASIFSPISVCFPSQTRSFLAAYPTYAGLFNGPFRCSTAINNLLYQLRTLACVNGDRATTAGSHHCFYGIYWHFDWTRQCGKFYSMLTLFFDDLNGAILAGHGLPGKFAQKIWRGCIDFALLWGI